MDASSTAKRCTPRTPTVVEIPMSAAEHLFQLFWQPEVMMILMLMAIYGIIAEIEPSGRDFARHRGRASR